MTDGWIVHTHLHPPRLPDDVIARPRLTAKLEAATRTHPVVLITAPTGYGKTTLLSQWLHGHAGERDRIAWLSLDQDTNTPVRFITYLEAALSPVCSSAPSTPRPLPHPTMAELRRRLGCLVNQVHVAAHRTITLILDDLHTITNPGVYALLTYLIDHQPHTLHVILATRFDPPLPLARLRAQGRLAELRLADLRFTLDETTSYLNNVLHLDLEPTSLKQLQERTEGWPTGIRLLASSLDHLPHGTSRARFITDFTHTSRYVFDFLADEVFNLLDHETRHFLLKTAILDEFTPALCRAVTCRDTPAHFLETLHRQGAFLVALQPDPITQEPRYRYHTLFAAFLRKQLDTLSHEHVTALHRRAAHFLEAQHPHRALNHYVAAGMWDHTIHLIETHGQRFIWQGREDILIHAVRHIPQHILQEHPRILYLWGLAEGQQGHLDRARHLLHLALHVAQDTTLREEIRAELATHAFLSADFQEGRHLLARTAHHTLRPAIQAKLLLERTWAHLLAGDGESASYSYAAALSLTRDLSDAELLHTLIVYTGPLGVLWPDALPQVERIHRRGLELIPDEPTLARALLETAIAFVAFWRGNLSRARNFALAALEKSHTLGHRALVTVDATALLAVLTAATGMERDAEDHFTELLHDASLLPLDAKILTGYYFLLAKHRWLQGQVDEARHIWEHIQRFPHTTDAFVRPLHRALLALLEMHAHHWTVAERLLHEVDDARRQALLLTFFFEPRVYLAHLYASQGQTTRALQALRPILATCETYQTPGILLKEGPIIVDLLRLAVERNVYPAFARRVLALLPRVSTPPRRKASTALLPLTPREIEVLQLLAHGASNREIARALVLSPETVKSHVSNVLRKLNVSSRVEAAVRAQDMGIV